MQAKEISRMKQPCPKGGFNTHTKYQFISLTQILNPTHEKSKNNLDTPGILAILHRDGSGANVGLAQPELYLSDMEYRTGMGTIPAEPVI